MRTLRVFAVSLAFLATAIAVVVVAISLSRPRLTETDVRTIVIDTILREESTSFLVTGTLEFVTEVNQESEKRLLPGILDLDLGTTIATVRAPGRAAYGFFAGGLDSTSIWLRDDTVFVRLPALEVFAVEPDLTRLERQVEVGWARLYRSSGKDAELEALRRLQPAMRLRASEYLLTSAYPRTNTEQAMSALLVPVLQASGMERPVLRFSHEPAPVDLRSVLAPERTHPSIPR